MLVTPEQTRHASRDEAELIAHEDLLRELSGIQRGSQRGFINERGNAPGDPQNAEERHPEDAQEDIPMDQVNDESGPQQDAPAEPLDPLRSAENEDASHEDEQGHAPPPPSREPDTSQADLGPHHSVELEPPVAQPHVEADLDESMQRPEERDQDNMNRIGRVRPRESDTREAAPVRRRLRRKTAPITVAYSIQHTEDDMAIENRMRDAFVARRTQPIKKGSRELRVIPPEWRDNFAQSDFAEWKKWLSYDAVERPRPEELDGLEKNDVLTFRMIRTDKNEATRGGKSYQDDRDQHPLGQHEALEWGWSQAGDGIHFDRSSPGSEARGSGVARGSTAPVQQTGPDLVGSPSGSSRFRVEGVKCESGGALNIVREDHTHP